ncbi:mechanosensitive ion channel family protein [Salipaludibacillus agaradhaerens]|uniref:mechanosensitive ion channel family protein n=1 Tax=Salipaludibacillus agaradhaerens TaxID=76935 RepID=UPI0021517FC2|nr:mechanosensitive ion channel family protein [Salipaludibacillus agaradhaerens]MCR6107245.1 mechanosensitive ion channel family protein [Salipaludibacillus agaradhaerens]MCR6119274.1 mechanosensitive ion channel family protein [Salipaludibacillus agaradhaerens]UJW58313.1 mechanosensitive ion channel family protein [Bacillus sp. A116_S68]
MNELIANVTWEKAAIAACIFFVILLLRKVMTTYVFKLILSLSRKAPTDLMTNILLAFEKPIRLLFVFIGLYAALRYLPFPADYNQIFLQFIRTLIIVHLSWGLFNLSASSSQVFTKIGEKLNVEVDDILLPFLSKLVRFAIVAMTLSIIADEWGYNVSGFVAGLGLGGLAFALAAQDSIGNFFGGVVIITEKPFTLGDWVKTPSVEGVVEDITFRSTKIRTFADSVVVVPNSTLANEPIENWAKMRKRQISFNLGVMYSTPKEKLERCVERLESYLRSREDIDQEILIVKFNEFNDSSLDIMLYFFTVPTAWLDYMEIKQEVNLKVLDILNEEEVTIAFPSRSIYMEKQADEMEIEQAMDVRDNEAK